MQSFIMHFLVCNLFLAAFIGILIFLKRLLNRRLSARMQYNLWFVLPVLLAFPFLPVKQTGIWQFLPFPSPRATVSKAPDMSQTVLSGGNEKLLGKIKDFSVSVGNTAPSFLCSALLCIWIAGILVVFFLTVRSGIYLHKLRKQSVPLHNRGIYDIYRSCAEEMHFYKKISIYHTELLMSPVTTGLFRPCIYLPKTLTKNGHPEELRYILLHEMMHCKHRDVLANYLMSLANTLYWFHPLVWYACRKIRNDRELACDCSVLALLKKEEYAIYGHTLINFAEKISLASLSFSAGISGNIEQVKQRILTVAHYQAQSRKEKIKGICLCLAVTVLFLGTAPVLSAYAGGSDYASLPKDGEMLSYVDYSSYFGKYDGSFVLYEEASDHWQIYNRDLAVLRVSPDSTYKVYNALLGLEEDIISPEHSQMSWDGTTYPFEEWNHDQTLDSAMKNSVNWYFHAINAQLNAYTVQNYIQKIGYGNQDISGDATSYWLESSLKISPVEQVELLQKLYSNEFGLDAGNIQAVKDAFRLSSSPEGSFYGKTGTGQADGSDINGWFIGCVEKNGSIYYFATNIQAESGATGSRAADITLSILSELGIWK